MIHNEEVVEPGFEPGQPSPIFCTPNYLTVSLTYVISIPSLLALLLWVTY